MNKHFYPAVFTEEENGYSISFPDLEGCFTEGDTLDEAYEMAKEAIGLYAETKDNTFAYPKASSPKDIKLKNNEFCMLVEFDELEYLKKHSNKAVKKTLTIPAYLNEMALEKNINFSNVLQEALKRSLDIR